MDRNSFLKRIVCMQIPHIETAIEIGVWRGRFSLKIIKTLAPKSFFGVDPYLLYPGYTDQPGPEFKKQEKLNQLHNEVQEKFQEVGGQLIRKCSSDAAKEFKDNSIDFIYLDADHQYESVKNDIAIWFPKVRKGGILAGHDYIQGSLVEDFGVIQAVNEFIDQHNLSLQTTDEKYATWWIVR